ncbi:MAG: hypothetical protein WCY05_00935 [Candidatus Omnitrophota bacterium]
MDKDYLLQNDGNFIIKNYNTKYPFSNFLPGVAGEWGIPMWVFYVNRAQGIASFGIKDKDHSITEFFPANNAYSYTPLVGFRTFLKINNEINYEPFCVVSSYEREEEMVVKSHSFEIKKVNHELGLQFNIKYFTLPNTPVGALARILSIKNISNKELNLQVLDGLSKIVPFGLSNILLKDLARTLEAWMRVSIKDNLSLFRLIVDPKDSSQTKIVEGANFNYAFYEDNAKKVSPYLIVDPAAIFSYDTSYSKPVAFFKKEFNTPLNQITCGKTPCAFSYFKWRLSPGETKDFYSIFGASFKAELVESFSKNVNSAFIKAKENENERIIEDIKSNALCVSAYKELDHYVGCSYLDNVLRGGLPYNFNTISKDEYNVYYIYSRKHGDLERDYNKFKLLPSPFSEGEANYRDINQNRRIDLFFNPHINRNNVIYFLNLLKIDGYNPLVVKGEKLFFSRKEAMLILKQFGVTNDDKVVSLMVCGFHLGDFFKLLKEKGINVEKRQLLASVIVKKASREPFASHGEGYWIDHWRYNLDLIENFLNIYPDKIKDLFLNKEYCFWDDEFRVKARTGRLHLKDKKVYQWHSVEEVASKKSVIEDRGKFANFLRDKKGNIYCTNLFEKILSLVLNKAASLDPDGIGVEMEADKPGWCDSLNGLPALFGSSLCETLEIKRACLMIKEALSSLKVKEITVSCEVSVFYSKIEKLLKGYLSSGDKDRDFSWWNRANLIKENFRKVTFKAVSGKTKKITAVSLEKFLGSLIAKLDIGITKAKDANGMYSTYFTYELKKYCLKNKQIIPLKFIKRALPYFLEGPVHALRTENDLSIYKSVKASCLFDEKLKNYRLNGSLKNEPLEIGRSRIFVPGWLENESIWLHMEYKYLLEVLKNGFYDEFFSDFKNCAVCFFDAEQYGRNILENSSFIVSSAFPDRSLWGKGFVARLSGATVELLNILLVMCLGKKPFFVNDRNELCLKFSPILKGDFFTKSESKVSTEKGEVLLDENSFAFKLFSKVLVVYHNPARKDTFDKSLRVEKIKVMAQGKEHMVSGSILTSPLANLIRETKVERIDVYFA